MELLQKLEQPPRRLRGSRACGAGEHGLQRGLHRRLARLQTLRAHQLHESDRVGVAAARHEGLYQLEVHGARARHTLLRGGERR